MKKYLLFVFMIGGCVAVGPTTRIEFDAPDTYPEGVAYDSLKDVFYVSSMREGTIGRVTPQGSYSVWHKDTSLKSSYGVKVHPDGKRLFVLAGDANYSRFSSPDTKRKTATLLILDLLSGNKIATIDLSGLVEGMHFPNDMTFDMQGNAYITDSYAHAIYKVDRDQRASVFARHALFETAGIGINGIVYHPAGYLLVNSSASGQIYKVPLSNPGEVQKVKINQYFLGADGMILEDPHTIIMAVNGGNDKIFRITSDDEWATAKLSATTLIADRFTYPATITRKGTDIWVMNAKTNELMDSNAVPAKKFAIQLARLIPVPEK